MRIKLKEIIHHKLKLNYKIKNKSKIHKKTSNKLKIKKIKTQVKTLINQMITLKFCTSNINFKGRIEKKEEQKALRATNHTVKKKKDFMVLMTWWRGISTAMRRFAYTNMCIANAISFFYLNNT
jgi:hypothetical protein